MPVNSRKKQGKKAQKQQRPQRTKKMSGGVDWSFSGFWKSITGVKDNINETAEQFSKVKKDIQENINALNKSLNEVMPLLNKCSASLKIDSAPMMAPTGLGVGPAPTVAAPAVAAPAAVAAAPMNKDAQDMMMPGRQLPRNDLEMDSDMNPDRPFMGGAKKTRKILEKYKKDKKNKKHKMD